MIRKFHYGCLKPSDYTGPDWCWEFFLSYSVVPDKTWKSGLDLCGIMNQLGQDGWLMTGIQSRTFWFVKEEI